MVDIEAMRRALREGESASLRRRRAIALLAAIGMVDFAVISLYQMGVIRHLPDLPGRVFDSDGVNASRKAYAMGLPDGTSGAALYATNLMLAAAGGTRKTGRSPALSFLLGASVLAGAGGAAHYLYDMVRHQKKVCVYCMLGAAVHFAMLPLAIAEVREESG